MFREREVGLKWKLPVKGCVKTASRKTYRSPGKLLLLRKRRRLEKYDELAHLPVQLPQSAGRRRAGRIRADRDTIAGRHQEFFFLVLCSSEQNLIIG